ncbi:MAG TPA: HEAT repeat domain-containing protein [Gemmataceae bacterium]|nr:HEAT repeat domain-containing protein [Gemmataceae bacterium]
MPRSFVSIRWTARIGVTFAIALAIGPGVARGQAKEEPIPPPREATRDGQPDAELRRRLEPLVPSIRAALQGNSPDAQRAALAVIADFPPGLLFQANLSGPIAAFLLKEHKDPDLVAFGLRSFGKSYPESPEVVTKVLGRHAKSENVEVRRAVGDALASVVQTLAPAGRSVANATAFIDMAKAVLPLLGELLEDKDAVTQKATMGGVQTVARVVVELYTFDTGPIGEEPKKEDDEKRFAPLAPVLKGLADVVPKLAAPLGSPDPDTRTAAARTAEYLAGVRRVVMSPPAAGAKPAADPFADRWGSLRAVTAERMKDPDPAVRLAVTEALEGMGDALPVKALLREATMDRSVFVRWAAARALGKGAPAKPDPAAVADDVAALARLVADADIDVRMAALNALARYGPAARPGAAVVLVAAGRGDIEPRVVAVRTLGALESEHSETVPVLIEALRDPDVRLRRAAASGLVRFGPDARPALPYLRRALSDPDQDLRIAAAEAILAIERPARLKDL